MRNEPSSIHRDTAAAFAAPSVPLHARSAVLLRCGLPLTVVALLACNADSDGGGSGSTSAEAETEIGSGTGTPGSTSGVDPSSSDGGPSSSDGSSTPGAADTTDTGTASEDSTDDGGSSTGEPVPPPMTTASIETKNARTCILLARGAVRCWGWNVNGRLGYGHTEDIGDDEVPATAGDVPLGGTVTQLSVGTNHACVVLEGGDVRCWGLGTYGRLGYGNTETIGDNETPDSQAPVNVGGTVVAVAAAAFHTCALLEDGAVRCWGDNEFHQLGHPELNDFAIGDNEDPAVLGDVDIGGTVVEIAAGGNSTCALLDTGNVRCWGGSFHDPDGFPFFTPLGYGGLGYVGDDETPASVGDLSLGGTATQIAVAERHRCAILQGGTLRCWGLGSLGILGYGNGNDIGDDELPEAAGDVPVGENIVQVETGSRTTCVVTDVGNVRCWGWSTVGALGYGNLDPVGLTNPASAGGDVSVGGPVAQVSTGGGSTCALLQNDDVVCWGTGFAGTLGYGNVEDIGDDELPSSAGTVQYQ